MTGATPAVKTGPQHLIGGIAIEIGSDRSGWYVTLTHNGETIATDRSGAKPWIDKRAPGRLTERIRQAVPTLDRTAIKEAVIEFFDDIGSSADGAALVSEPVARVIGATAAVTIELSDPPAYIVDLIGGETLTFSAREMNAMQPVTLNEKWLSAHPRDPLRAKTADFEEIQQYWFSIAEEAEPHGTKSTWEAVTEKLQIAIAPRTVYPTKDGLTKTGLYQEDGGPLWIAGSLIGSVLKDTGKSEMDTGFSRYLQKAGVLVGPSKPIRVGRMLIRAWGFSPDFRPDDEAITDFAELSPNEEEV